MGQSSEFSRMFSGVRLLPAYVYLAIVVAGCANGSSNFRPTSQTINDRFPKTMRLVSSQIRRDRSPAENQQTENVEVANYDSPQLLQAPTNLDGSESLRAGQRLLSTSVHQKSNGTDNAASKQALSLEVPLEPTKPKPFDLKRTDVSGTKQPVDYFVSVALEGHPKIRAARQRVGAASNVIPQVRALPDPEMNNTFWPVPSQGLQTAAGRADYQISLSQRVPWPEKLSTKASIASREVQIAQAEVEQIEREITESVRLAYYELWFSRRAIEIVNETRSLVNDLTKVAEARYKAGGTQQDVLRAQLEVDRLDDQLVRLRKQKEQAQADLASLLQQPVNLIPEAEDLIGFRNVPKKLDELISLAEQCSPELKGIMWEIQRDRQKQRLSCLQKYPDFQLGVNYGVISDSGDVTSRVADGNDNLSLSIGLTLPIYREKINAGINEAAYRTGSSTRRLQAERDALYGKLRRLLVQADALGEQSKIYQHRIIPRTEDTLKLSFADYQGKRTDFFTLIETYRELLLFETQLARIEATLAGTIAQIERAVGCPAQ